VWQCAEGLISHGEFHIRLKAKIQKVFFTPIVVQKGIPVKWIINVEKGDLSGCNNPLTIPKYNIRKKLEVGKML